MFLYKSEESNIPFLKTHFLYPNQTKNYKTDINFFNQSAIDDIKIQNCIDEMNSSESKIHSVLLLCDYFQKNPVKVYNKFEFGDVIAFFRFMLIPDTQKPVLRSICFFLQLIKDNHQFQQLILRMALLPYKSIKAGFYYHINDLIESSTDNEIQQLALCCALYSLDLSSEVRQCIYENDILKTLMSKTMLTDFSEYLRGKFFKVASKYCHEMDEFSQNNFISFLIQVIQSISPNKKSNSIKKYDYNYYCYEDIDNDNSSNQSNSKLLVAELILALENTFSESYYGFELIERDNLFPLFIFFLNSSKEPKLRRSSAKIIYSLIISQQISTKSIIEDHLIRSLFMAATFNDPALFVLCKQILKYLFDNQEFFDLVQIINHIVELDFSECFQNSRFEIKMELLSFIQLVVFNSSSEQVAKMFSPQNIQFFFDLIDTGNCGVSTDVSHIFLFALERQTDISFLDMVKGIAYESGIIEQIFSQMNDPDNSPNDIKYLQAFYDFLQ